MSLIGAVLFCSVVSSGYATWMKDICSPRGLDVGSGFVARLSDSKQTNVSFFDRVALRMDYGPLGISVGKKNGTAAMGFSFHVNDVGEARHKKKDMTMPFLIGFKAASLVTAILGGTKLLVMKALMIAKLALFASAAILMKKIFQSEESHPSIEIEHHGSEQYPVYAEYNGMEYSYPPSSPDMYYGYNNYSPSGGAESIINYSTVDTGVNATGAVNQPVALAGSIVKRKDHRRKHKLTATPTMITIKRYSVET